MLFPVQLLVCGLLVVFGWVMFRDSNAPALGTGFALHFPSPTWEDAFRFHESRERASSAPLPQLPVWRAASTCVVPVLRLSCGEQLLEACTLYVQVPGDFNLWS